MSFLWGAATSGHQIEGDNKHSDWWAWERAGNIEGGARSGSACEHWKRRREDIALAADLGLNAYRFSVEWSRWEPELGKWDNEAIEWYRELLHDCEKHKLRPMLTLHHFTSPQWFSEQGGFCWEKSVEHYLGFVKRVAKALGPRVPMWCTLNEANVLVAGTYLARFMPPGRFSVAQARLAWQRLQACHIQGYRLLHEKISERAGPWRKEPLQVGYAHNVVDFMADRAWHPADGALAFAAQRFYNHDWIARTLAHTDFIGLNYYTKGYLRWRPRAQAPHTYGSTRVGVELARRKEAQSDMGWALHPQGLGRLLRWAGRFGKAIYVTENGIADSTDTQRPAYLLAHLHEIARARMQGVDVRGYFHWSLLDNFEWIKGFGPRFGLYRVDYETQARSLTHSGALYRETIAAHGHGAPKKETLQRVAKNFKPPAADASSGA